MMQLLPAADAPLRRADGTIVHANGRVETPQQQRTEALRKIVLAPTQRRQVTDLPVSAPAMNAIGAVMLYSLFGLADVDICEQTKLQPDQLSKVRSSQAYGELQQVVIETVLNAEADDVRSYLQRHARPAAEALVRHVNSNEPGISIPVARDILDRTGHRPVDVHEHRHRMDGALLIEIVQKEDTRSLPQLDLSASTADGA